VNQRTSRCIDAGDRAAGVGEVLCKAEAVGGGGTAEAGAQHGAVAGVEAERGCGVWVGDQQLVEQPVIEAAGAGGLAGWRWLCRSAGGGGERGCARQHRAAEQRGEGLAAVES
jgi:hypothetical protein